jgi:hypothetical protein
VVPAEASEIQTEGTSESPMKKAYCSDLAFSIEQYFR